MTDKVDFNNVETKKEIYETVAKLCYDSGLPIAGDFMNEQAVFAATEIYIQEQDKALDEWSRKTGS